MLIALTGKKFSGKSTSAKYLAKSHNFKVGAFAKKGKDTCGDIFDLSHEQLYGELKEVIDKRYSVTPVFIMQRFMTEVARYIYSDIWIECFAREHAQDISLNKDIVIEDLRFENEAIWVKSVGGIIIQLTRKQTEIESEHESEHGIPDELIDFYIGNHGKDYSSLYHYLERTCNDFK